jgi:hypothetical protein
MSKRQGQRLTAELANPSWRSLALKDLHARLRVRYPEKECALFHEVRNETGWSSSPRYADALAMGLWPSRGLRLEGFECKVDRSDWLRELRAPEKADAIAPYCDLWWIVSPADPVVVKLDEVPPTWGWLVPHGSALKVVKPATPNPNPTPVDRSFLASVFRAAQGESTIAARLDKLRDEMRRERDQSVEYAEQRAAREGKELREAVAEFEKASGLSISRWTAGDVGARLKALQALEHKGESVERLIRNALDRMERDSNELRRVLSTLQPTPERSEAIAS